MYSWAKPCNNEPYCIGIMPFNERACMAILLSQASRFRYGHSATSVLTVYDQRMLLRDCAYSQARHSIRLSSVRQVQNSHVLAKMKLPLEIYSIFFAKLSVQLP